MISISKSPVKKFWIVYRASPDIQHCLEDGVLMWRDYPYVHSQCSPSQFFMRLSTAIQDKILWFIWEESRVSFTVHQAEWKPYFSRLKEFIKVAEKERDYQRKIYFEIEILRCHQHLIGLQNILFWTNLVPEEYVWSLSSPSLLGFNSNLIC